jgi:phosphocarrier protein HPr
MAERSLEVVNRLGLHARASAKLVQTLAPFKSTVLLTHRGRQINAKSIMGLMMLAAAKGSVLQATAEGEDADAALDAVSQLFADRFGEDE